MPKKHYVGLLRRAPEPHENVDWTQLKSGVWEDAMKGDFSKPSNQAVQQLKQLQGKQVEIRKEIDKIAKKYRKGMGGRFPKEESKLKASFKKGLGKPVYKDFIKKIKTYNDIQKRINKIKPGGNMMNFMHAIDPNVSVPPKKERHPSGDPRTYKKRTKVSEAPPPPVMKQVALPDDQPLSLVMEQVALPGAGRDQLPEGKKKAQRKKTKSKKSKKSKKGKKGKKTKRYSRRMRGGK